MKKKESQIITSTPNFNHGSPNLLQFSPVPKRGSLALSFPSIPSQSLSNSQRDSHFQHLTPLLQVLKVDQARNTAKSIVMSHAGNTRLQITPTLTPSNMHGSERSA